MWSSSFASSLTFSNGSVHDGTRSLTWSKDEFSSTMTSIIGKIESNDQNVNHWIVFENFTFKTANISLKNPMNRSCCFVSTLIENIRGRVIARMSYKLLPGSGRQSLGWCRTTAAFHDGLFLLTITAVRQCNDTVFASVVPQWWGLQTYMWCWYLLFHTWFYRICCVLL